MDKFMSTSSSTTPTSKLNPFSPNLVSSSTVGSVSNQQSVSENQSPRDNAVILDEGGDNIEIELVGDKRKPKKKSAIWDHFTRIKKGNPNKPRASCNYCGDSYACSSITCGTSSMWSHLKKQCLKSPFRIVDKKQKVLSFQIKTESGGGGSSLLAFGYNKDACRRSLARMIVLDELPFSSVEGEGFKGYSQVMQPQFTTPCRTTVARDILNLFEEERAKLKVDLKKNCQRVSLTTDGWTSVQNLCYMCLTGHYVDSDWKLQKRILNFCIVPNHKGETTGRIIEQCLHAWELDKIFTVTVDNAYANDSALTTLKRRVNGWNGTVLEGQFMHVRCSAHIINLIVSEGLKDLHNSVSGIRNSVRYVRGSPARLQKFKLCVEREKIDYKGLLVLDVPTRWNSTFKMLDVAVKFQKAFERYGEEDDNFLGHFSEVEHGKKVIGPPLNEDWDNARVFIRFLKTFYDITKKFSASLHVTSNLYYHDVCKIHMQLKELSKSGDTLLSNMAIGMLRKFEKYYVKEENLNFLMFIPIVLDPRYKLDYLKYMFGLVYDPIMSTKYTKKVVETLNGLFKSYNEGVGDEKVIVAEEEKSVIEGCLDENDILLGYIKQRDKAEKNEIEKYLAEDNESPLKKDFDILSWWKDKQHKYKILSSIARDVLAIQVSTVASESAFSTGGRILDPFRSSLSPKMVEALICTQNWLSSTHNGINVKDYFEDGFEHTESEL